MYAYERKKFINVKNVIKINNIKFNVINLKIQIIKNFYRLANQINFLYIIQIISIMNKNKINESIKLFNKNANNKLDFRNSFTQMNSITGSQPKSENKKSNQTSSLLSEKVVELNLNNTLGKNPPVNPLNSGLVKQNNLADSVNTIRTQILNAIQSIQKETSKKLLNPLSLESSNEVLEFMAKNDTKFKQFIMDDSKLFQSTNKNDLYLLFVRYVLMVLRKYIQNPSESFISSKNLKQIYEMLNSQNQSLIGHGIKNNLKDLFFEGSAFQKAANSFSDIFNGFTAKPLKYIDFLNQYCKLCSNVFDFINSQGSFNEFLEKYGQQSFAGLNIAGFNDKMGEFIKKIITIPSDTTESVVTYTQSNNIINSVQIGQIKNTLVNDNTSIIACLFNMMVRFILHLIEKFGSGSENGYITENGMNVLMHLLMYIVGDKNDIQSLNSRFGGDRDILSDSELKVILGKPEFDKPNNSDSTKYTTIKFGVLQYIAHIIQILLESSDDILLFDPADNTREPVSYPRDNGSYFGGSYKATAGTMANPLGKVDWTKKRIQSDNNSIIGTSFLNTPSLFNTKNVPNKQFSFNVLVDGFNPESIVDFYVQFYMNHIENFNAESNKNIKFIVVGEKNTIVKYDQFAFTDSPIIIPQQEGNYISFPQTNSKGKYFNHNLATDKDYSIAIVNNLLFSIITDSFKKIPELSPNDIDIKENDEGIRQFIYTTKNTDYSICVLYMINTWHKLLYNSFSGSNSYFNMSTANQISNILPNLKLSVLVEKQFYLYYLHDIKTLEVIKKFLNKFDTEDLTILVNPNSNQTTDLKNTITKPEKPKISYFKKTATRRF